MRMFEATSCGALLITKRIPFIEDFWKDGEDIILYNTNDELVEKVKYYLSNDKERELIAKSGQEKTLKNHTYLKRANTILEKLFQHE
jgi:spore maturation protein CgeB